MVNNIQFTDITLLTNLQSFVNPWNLNDSRGRPSFIQKLKKKQQQQQQQTTNKQTKQNKTASQQQPFCISIGEGIY